jgi:hypothetical protein
MIVLCRRCNTSRESRRLPKGGTKTITIDDNRDGKERSCETCPGHERATRPTLAASRQILITPVTNFSGREALEMSNRKAAAKAGSEGTEDARDQRLG